MADQEPWHERREVPAGLDSLLQRLLELQSATKCDEPAGSQAVKYAFRGLPHADWRLEPTLLHKCKASHDDAGLWTERELVEQFRREAWRFVREIERQYLSVGDIGDSDPVKAPLQWEQPNIWSAIAIARHCGVPPRLLDWTHSAWIAAYFAASSEPACDGAVWWFDQLRFDSVLDGQWEYFDVPNGAHGQRAMEKKAFDGTATRWVSKIHHRAPFRRLEVQQGFFTACGRLDMLHDRAIEDLKGGSEIGHGRLIMPARLKKPLLDTLEYMGVHAHAIDYPGADLVGQRLVNQGPLEQSV